MLLLSNPFRQVAIHPSNYLQNFSMYFLYSIQIPTNGLIMKDSVTETPEQVKWCRNVTSFSLLPWHIWESTTKCLP